MLKLLRLSFQAVNQPGDLNNLMTTSHTQSFHNSQLQYFACSKVVHIMQEKCYTVGWEIFPA